MRGKIDAALKEAVQAGDDLRIATLRLIRAALKDKTTAHRTEDGGELTREEFIALLTQMVRQREETATTYEENGHMELAEQERAEQAVIREFLPRMMTDEEIDAAVGQAIAHTGASSIRDIGPVMTSLKAEYLGRMDFVDAAARVRRRLV